MTAKLTIENDLTTRMTERQPVTSVLQDSGQKSSIETFVLYLKFWLRFKVSNIDPLPRKAVSRCAAYKKSQRSVKHIWFLPTQIANAEKPKELALPITT